MRVLVILNTNNSMVFDEFDCFLYDISLFPTVRSMTPRSDVIWGKEFEKCLRFLSRLTSPRTVFLGCPTSATAEVTAATDDGRNATRRTRSHPGDDTPKDFRER